MSATTLDAPQPSFASAEELAALRADVAELRRQVSQMQVSAAPSDWRSAIARLQAGYEALSDEARTIHAEAEAEARVRARDEAPSGARRTG